MKHIATLLALAVLAATATPAHAATRVDDESFDATVLAPGGVSLIGGAALGIAGTHIGGVTFDFAAPAAAGSLIEFFVQGTTGVGTYAYQYTVTTLEGGVGQTEPMDCTAEGNPAATTTCYVPENATSVTFYVYEDVDVFVAATLYHFE